ncbi:MAG TPA: zinc-dependent metalloprotease [Thermoanaerobaculia bacterium]|nr:zinc-dependent metalloprotease [Thermoanaerobaculia bacterium]
MTLPARFLVSAAFFLLLPLSSASLPAVPRDEKPGTSEASKGLPGISKLTAGLEKKEGLLDLYLDRQKGKIWLEVPPATGRDGAVGSYLYVESLLTGLGSNPVGLDRGQLGDTRVVTFRRVGGRLLVEQPNLRFRALSENPAELRAVRESFATSILWAGEIAALDPDGRALVEFTPFLVRDAHEIASRMKRAGQGAWKLDPARSVVDPESCLAFPENLEFESLLTYESDEPGELVRETTPTANAVTLVQHHSLLRLPEPGYAPRRFDPRAGSYSVDFIDYAAPLAAPIEVRWLVRHRLQKVDPTAARSRVKEPIVFYVDPGAPEPVRSALVEGAGWWREAFDKAGFIDAYRVELLPEGAHPLDARYNVIQWVHRSTRGWSYGGGVIDPRTGEMVKGHVTLGSLRVRQDRLLFEGLLGVDRTGSGGADDPVQLSLARIRQLAAHEVGHALGLAHNFAASTYGGRASVMDYPAPLIGIADDGRLDVSNAYGVGVGEWDVHAVRYAYAELPPGTDERKALEDILREGEARGLLFLTDEDARSEGSAHPRAHLWDNGPDAVAGLLHALRVRQIGLAGFGERNIAAGQPVSLLQEVLVPLYFHHRYQLEAATKVVGGLEYTYAIRGSGQPASRPVDGKQQRAALAAILRVLAPETLDLPEPVISLMLPRPAGYQPNREMFTGLTAPAFDPLAAASTAADMAVQGLLRPERASRLVDFHRRDPSLPGLDEVLNALIETSFGGTAVKGPRHDELRRTVQWVVVRRLIGLSGDPQASPGVRARVDATLAGLGKRLSAAAGSDPQAAHRAFLAREIERYLERGEQMPAGQRPEPPPPPPGQPIGMPSGAPEGLGGCSWGD